MSEQLKTYAGEICKTLDYLSTRRQGEAMDRIQELFSDRIKTLGALETIIRVLTERYAALMKKMADEGEGDEGKGGFKDRTEIIFQSMLAAAIVAYATYNNLVTLSAIVRYFMRRDVASGDAVMTIADIFSIMAKQNNTLKVRKTKEKETEKTAKDEEPSSDPGNGV